MASLINKAKDKLSSSSSSNNNSSGTTENTTTGSYEQATPNYSGTAHEQPGQDTYGGTSSTEQPSFSNFGGTESSTAAAGTTKTGPVHTNEALNKIDPRVHEQKPTTTTGATK